MTSTFSTLTVIDTTVAYKMSPNAWTLVSMQETCNFSALLPHSATRVPPIKLQLSLQDVTASSGKSRSVLRRIDPNDTPQLEFSYILDMVHTNVEVCWGKNTSLTYYSTENASDTGNSSEMMPSNLTALSVPEYRPDIRLTSFGGIPRRARILQGTSRSPSRITMIQCTVDFLCVKPDCSWRW